MYRLTAREDKIMELYNYGFTSQEISQQLNLPTRRVNYYMSRIYKKLVEKNRLREQNKL